MPHAVVVSHPAVIAVNQLPHAELIGLGWDVTVIVPGRWRHEYRSGSFRHEVLPALDGRVRGCRVLNPGAVQRHVYLDRPGRILRETKPDFVFVEEEPTSLPALQWGRACAAARLPFALQMDENLDRPYPRVARWIRDWTLRRAAFVAARSPPQQRWRGHGGIPARPPSFPTPCPPGQNAKPRAGIRNPSPSGSPGGLWRRRAYAT